jgi:SAM-dependent methyltransferase
MDVYTFNTKKYTENPTAVTAGWKLRVKKITELVGNNQTVLDLGCFDGTVGKYILDNQNIVYGVDASSVAVPKAIQKGIKAKIGNLEEKLDFPDNFFDVVVAGETIEHIFEIDFFMKEIHRVLKPNGYVVMSTPNLAALGRRLMLLVNINPHIDMSNGTSFGGHIRYFVKHTLFELLNRQGFKITHFTSDVINLNASGKLYLAKLASLIPTIGSTLIVKAQKL